MCQQDTFVVQPLWATNDTYNCGGTTRVDHMWADAKIGTMDLLTNHQFRSPVLYNIIRIKMKEDKDEGF